MKVYKFNGERLLIKGEDIPFILIPKVSLVCHWPHISLNGIEHRGWHEVNNIHYPGDAIIFYPQLEDRQIYPYYTYEIKFAKYSFDLELNIYENL